VRQFDVFTNPSEASRDFAPFVVMLQSHHLRDIDTAIVAPLIRESSPILSGFDLPISFNGESLYLAVSELGSVEIGLLRRAVGSLVEHDYEIRRALDRLFTGF
jgi:toxin CcdB